MRMVVLCLFSSLFFLVSNSNADWTLSPIVKEASPVETLQEDSVVDSFDGETKSDSAGGSVGHSLTDELPFTITERGQPGVSQTLFGLGKSSEDTSVQALGVPLNFPQGGGFDLSIFPQFMWSRYRFQLGPPLATFDPGAVSGTLTLVPWTQQALLNAGTRVRGTGLYSTVNLFQVSAAAANSEGTFAALAGWSAGSLRGPSGSFSGRWRAGPNVSGQYHLLATQVEGDSQGATTDPTPGARRKTTRLIPVVQADFTLSPEMILKTSVFYDKTELVFDSPTKTYYNSSDQVRELGLETALLWREWRMGLNGRRVSLQGLQFQPPADQIVNLQASRSIEFDHWLIEPSIQATNVSGTGFYPSGSIGARKELGRSREHVGNTTASVFSRLSYNRRFASLVDRYYVFPGFSGNPDLRPERTWTGVLGAEVRSSHWTTSLQGYAQRREDAQVSTATTIVNSGQANIHALIHGIQVKPSAWLELSQSLTLASSKDDATGQAFAYIPAVTELLKVEVRKPSELPSAWVIQGIFRAATGAVAPFSTEGIAGYGYLDLGVKLQLSKELEASGRIENLFDRKLEFVRGYPLPGRIYSVGLIGQL